MPYFRRKGYEESARSAMVFVSFYRAPWRSLHLHRCSIGVRQALQPWGWRALVQRAPFRFWLVYPRAVLSKLGITCSYDRLVPGLLLRCSVMQGTP
jgi:hypothetical protein